MFAEIFVRFLATISIVCMGGKDMININEVAFHSKIRVIEDKRYGEKL